jgi:hypothetical protein
MAKAAKARPTKASVRAVSCDADDDAEARRLAGIEQRKRTVRATMVYAGTGLRASERVKKAAEKKPTAKKAAAKKPTTTKPARKQPAAKKTRVSKTAKSKKETGPPAAPDTAAKRKSSRTQSQLIRRLVNTIDGQLDQIDTIMRNPKRGPNEAERCARAVAALARVTVELRKELEAGRRRRADDNNAAGCDPSADPDRPRDLDELRERLSRRLDERLRGGSAVSMGDDAAGGNRLPE